MLKVTPYILLLITALIPLSSFLPVSSSHFAPRKEKTDVFYPEFKSRTFLNTDQNLIKYPGTAEKLHAFYDKLEELCFNGKGKVTLMHMGGSHVQAGVLSNRIRENLFGMAEGIKGERGFFFPFRLAKTNSPFNIKARYTGEWEGCRNAIKSADCDWGLSGINATTRSETAGFSIHCFDSDSLPYPFKAVNIYHPMNESELCLEPDSSLRVNAIIRDTLGGFTRLVFQEETDTLVVNLYKSDSAETEFTLQGLKFERTYTDGLTYQAIGVNGASVPSYLRCGSFTQHLRSNKPDLVIFGIGINDAYMPSSQFDKEEFKSNYIALMDSIRSVNPEVAFLFLTNNDSYYKRRRANRNGITVQQAMYELAEKEGAALWDLFEVMGGLNSVRSWEDAGLAKRDKIHFTRQGYELEADMLSQAFIRDFGDYLKQKNPNTFYK